MKALYYLGSSTGGGVEWRDVPPPTILEPSDALVRPIAASTCDLDQAILHSSMPGAEQPFELGHEAVGEVLEVGRGVTRVRPGDIVVIPYHLACGSCDRCVEEIPLFCRTTAADAMAVFGVPVGADYGGLFSELVRVPFADYGLVKLPPSVSPLDAVSVGDNLTDAYRSIAPWLRAHPGSDVLIMSGGSIGLYAVEIAFALGSRSVRYVDANGARRMLAGDLGARASTLDELYPGEQGFSISLVTHGSGDALRAALMATGPGGHVENLGFHFAEVPLPVAAMHFKCLTFRSAVLNARPLFPEVLALLASGRISPRRVQTAVLPFEQAVEALPTAGFKPVFVRDPINSTD